LSKKIWDPGPEVGGGEGEGEDADHVRDVQETMGTALVIFQTTGKAETTPGRVAVLTDNKAEIQDREETMKGTKVAPTEQMAQDLREAMVAGLLVARPKVAGHSKGVLASKPAMEVALMHRVVHKVVKQGKGGAGPRGQEAEEGEAVVQGHREVIKDKTHRILAYSRCT